MAESLTHRRVLNIAVPLVLSNATIPILGAVDTGVVGQMGLAAPIGAVGIGAMILTALYWVFGFLRMGTTGFAAQALGQGDRDESTAILTRALTIGLSAGLVIILLHTPLFALGFYLSPASAEVETMARSYMKIRVWTAPALISIYAITGWLIAAERTRAVLALQVWMNGLNILLDLWFVLGLGWGVEGVAIATVIAEASGALLGLWFCRAAFASPAWRDWARILNPAKLKRFAMVNTDILIRSLFLQAIFMSFLFLGARFGDVQLAANQILLQFLSISAFSLDGFAFAVESLVGQAMGSRDRGKLRRAAILCAFWGVMSALVMMAIFALFGSAIIDRMTTAPDVRAVAHTYLPWAILSPILAVGAFILDGIFIGATRTGAMRNMMVLSALIYAVAVLTLSPLLGNHGLWLALMVSFVARGLTLFWHYPALEAQGDMSA